MTTPTPEDNHIYGFIDPAKDERLKEYLEEQSKKPAEPDSDEEQ